MGRLEVELPEQIENGLENRIQETGQTKSEITRNALVKELNL